MNLTVPVMDYLFSFFTDEPTFENAIVRALPKEDERLTLISERDELRQKLTDIEKQIARFAKAIREGADFSLFLKDQEELKQNYQQCKARLGEAESKLNQMPSREIIANQAMTIRLSLLKNIQEHDWRKMEFEQVKRFLIFLFGENPGRTGNGIQVGRSQGQWNITFRGKVGFHHDIVNGRPLSHLVKMTAEAENARLSEIVALKQQT